MIVGIVKDGSGEIPLEEFRGADDTDAAVSAFCADHTPPLTPSDYVGIDTGWAPGAGWESGAGRASGAAGAGPGAG